MKVSTGIVLLALGIVCPSIGAGAEVSSDEWYQAIRANDLAKIRSWIAGGANVNVKNARGNTPLMFAAQVGSPEAMKMLIDAKADVNAKNAFEATALLYAAGTAEKAKMLVAAGADVNVKSKQGQVPIVAAASHSGNLETVKLLLSKGADPNSKGALGATALVGALQFNDLDIARVLLERGVSVSAERQRLARNEIESLEKGASVNTGDGGGFTPLHYAAGHNNLEAVKMLLAKGANVNASNKFGGQVKNGPIALVQLTPLMLAAPFGSPELIKTLLDAGADVNAIDVRGMTALMLAVASENQDPRVAKLLLERGADPKIKSKTGETAIDWAGKFNSPQVMQALGSKPGGKIMDVANTQMPARTALAASLALIENSSQKFFTEGGCAGCHHTNMASIAAGTVRKYGLPVNEPLAAERVKQMKGMWLGFQELLLQRVDPPGNADTLMYAALALGAEKYPADAVTDAIVFNIAGEQLSTGRWSQMGISRSPIEENDIHRTAMNARALAIYGPPGRKAEFDGRIAKARTWLEQSAPKTGDDLAMLAIGLKWTGSSDAKVQAAAKALRNAQRADGGWAPNTNLASDPYHTGQALYVLHELGILKPADAAYKKGVAFLLGTRKEDGSWYVKSRAPKFQPYFESGFPYGHDQWISATATAWAVMALAPAAEATPSRAAAR